ncbi:MAG: XdhC family protein [Alphaproteobacteria bacterium]
MKSAHLDALLAAKAKKQPAVLATDLKTGAAALVIGDSVTGTLALPEEARATIPSALRADKSQIVQTAAGPIFLQVFNPPLRMFVIGAVHISQALAPMAAMTGYDVTIIDPRRSFATAERFPGVAVTHDWPDEALDRLGIDARTAIVTLTHDPKIDDPALDRALKSNCFYVGSLGSKKTHNARLYRLKQAGFSDADVARIAGPVGLAIGAKSPAEIAVSIMAQITQTLRGGGDKGAEKSTDKGDA